MSPPTGPPATGAASKADHVEVHPDDYDSGVTLMCTLCGWCQGYGWQQPTPTLTTLLAATQAHDCTEVER